MSKLEFASYTSYFNKSLLPSGVIHWSEVENHMNETVSIYGEAVYTDFNWDEYERTVGWDVEPPNTFIEIGMPYDEAGMVLIVIPGRYRNKFQTYPEELYKNKAIIFSGKLFSYQSNRLEYAGIPTIQIVSQSSIQIVEPIENLYASKGLVDYRKGYFKPVFDIVDEEEAFSHRLRESNEDILEYQMLYDIYVDQNDDEDDYWDWE